MWLRKLDVSNFRNIEHASLTLNPRLNFIVGSNGSGKSSLLEAIHCLSTGQSFRTNKALPIIHSGSSEAIIFGELVTPHHIHRIGIKKRSQDGSILRLDSNSTVTQSELALLTPIVGITPESEDLLEGGNKNRLSFLDWTLFHVEPSFRHNWREYKRTLKQRNAALRARMADKVILSWDDALATTGEYINQLRINLIKRLVPQISEYLRALLPQLDISISYRRGWSKETSLHDALRNTLESDRNTGFTHAGVHRADLVLRSEDRPLTERFSRGQRKLVIIAMRLAQISDYMTQLQQQALLYIDDLPAELDMCSREKVFTAISQLKSQAIISATSSHELPLALVQEHGMFHVEQGVITNVV